MSDERDDDPRPSEAARSATGGYADRDGGDPAREAEDLAKDPPADPEDWPDDASKFVTAGEDDDAKDSREERR